MPPLPPVAGVVKVALVGTDSGGFPWANIIHVAYSGSPPVAGGVQGLGDLAAAGWGTNMSPMQSTGTTFESATVTDLSSADGATFEVVLAQAGTREGAIIPGSAAFLISYPGTTPRYRGGHPRQYLLAGVQPDLLDEAHWTDDFVSACQDAWATFIAGITNIVVDSTAFGDQVAVSYYTTDYSTTPHTRVRKTVPSVIVLPTINGNSELASQRGRIGRRRR